MQPASAGATLATPGSPKATASVLQPASMVYDIPTEFTYFGSVSTETDLEDGGQTRRHVHKLRCLMHLLTAYVVGETPEFCTCSEVGRSCAEEFHMVHHRLPQLQQSTAKPDR